MASNLTDDELRRKLTEFGEDVGPITDTTRRLYERRLDDLIIKAKKGKYPKLHSSFEATRSRRRNINRNRSSYLLNYSSDENVSDDDRSYQNLNRSTDTFDGGKYNSHFNSSRLGRSFESGSSHSKYDTSFTRRSLRENDPLSNKYSLPQDLDISDSEVEPSHSPSSTKTSTLFNWRPSIFSRKGKDANSYTSASSKNGFTYKSIKAYKGPKPEFRCTSYPTYISWLLVVLATLFFIGIGLVYISSYSSYSILSSNLSIPICKTSSWDPKTDAPYGDYSCIEESYVNETLELSYNLYSYLSQAAGSHQCGFRSEARISDGELKKYLESLYPNMSNLRFYQNYMYSLLLIRENPSLQIKFYYEENSKERLLDIVALEALNPTKSFWCRWKLAFSYTLSQIIFLILVMASCLIFYCAFRYKYHQWEEEKKQMYGLVEKIIERLKEQFERPFQDQSERPYLAVAHIRDALIPLSQREKLLPIWDKAVAFLEANESRVRVEYKDIAGEKFKVWRWLPSGACLPTHQGRIWQGQAFGSSSRGMNILPFSPTSFLKIRNMFDSQIESGTEWVQAIKDAILEKCEGSRVVHIHVDPASAEGCVYLKCQSTDDAYKTYRALHGWWFAGKLVTVKFLRPERYHEKFPDAINCHEPLKPSNNLRLSLAQPYQSSSPLEAS